MKNLILTLIITFPLTLWGQGWEQTYYLNENPQFHYGVGWSVIETDDDTYIISGHSNVMDENGSSIETVVLCKIQTTLETNGLLLWEEFYTPGWGSSVKETLDNGFIILNTPNNFNSPVELIKTGSSGNIEWIQNYEDIYGGGNVFNVQLTNDDGYIFSTMEKIVKTNSQGVIEWIFNETNNNGTIYSTNDNSYLFTGSSPRFLSKLNNNGISEWIYYPFGEDDSDGYWLSIIENSSGEYVISGENEITKINNQGDVSWTISPHNQVDLSSTFSCTYYNTYEVSGGGYISVGQIQYSDGSDIFLVKIDYEGNIEWFQRFVLDQDSGGYDVQETNDGGFILVGHKGFNGGNWTQGHIHLIKTNSFGNITSTFEIPLPNPNRKLEKTVNLKGQEIKPQTNQPVIEIYDDGTVEKKMIIE